MIDDICIRDLDTPIPQPDILNAFEQSDLRKQLGNKVDYKTLMLLQTAYNQGYREGERVMMDHAIVGNTERHRESVQAANKYVCVSDDKHNYGPVRSAAINTRPKYRPRRPSAPPPAPKRIIKQDVSLSLFNRLKKFLGCT